jgi:vancomycin permeability regulator SanA
MTRGQKIRRFTFWAFITLFSITFLYLAFTFFQVYSAARTDDVKDDTRVDAIVVLGAAQYNGRPSAVLQARLDHALELYNRGIAPIIIVTGGNQQGDNSTEASASADYLLERGVADENILREVHGSSTFDSLRDTAAFAKERGIEEVVLVTDGFHELRSRLIAEEHGLKGVSSPAQDSPISGAQEWKNFMTETARVSAGRIIGFRRVSRDSTLVNFVRPQ